jgi:hypothetical protein
LTALRRRSFKASIDNLRPSILSILYWMKLITKELHSFGPDQ